MSSYVCYGCNVCGTDVNYLYHLDPTPPTPITATESPGRT
jgi:hypothetical protein